MEEIEKFYDLVLKESKNGKVVFMTFDGPKIAILDDFIKQPIEGLLYDLNRDMATVRTFMKQDNPKWVNDFAVALVITKLKAQNDVLKEEINKLKSPCGVGDDQ